MTQFGPYDSDDGVGRRLPVRSRSIFHRSDSRDSARYRCVYCRREQDGPERTAPPCAACGRRTVRVVERHKVVLVESWAAESTDRSMG